MLNDDNKDLQSATDTFLVQWAIFSLIQRVNVDKVQLYQCAYLNSWIHC